MNSDLLWHYTTIECLGKILEYGAIKPADAFLDAGERPVVWFSKNQQWEHTANKIVLENGTYRKLSRKEMFTSLGVARIGVSHENVSTDWNGFKRQGNTSSKMLKALAATAKEVRASPSDWSVSFEQVPADKWTTVEVWDIQKNIWQPIEEWNQLVESLS